MNKLMNIKTITSKEIESLTGKRHDNIIRDIDKLNINYENMGLLKSEEGSYTLKSTGKQEHRMFILTKIQCLDLMTGYNTELRIKVNRRWEELEAKYLSEQLRIKSRQISRLENPKMTKALQDHRAEEGKKTKAFHYSNENNLIYLVVLGATAKRFKDMEGLTSEESLRDNLTPMQIEAVEKIQNMNTTLIDLGEEYKTRKAKLNTFFEKRFAAKILDELIKLNA